MTSSPRVLRIRSFSEQQTSQFISSIRIKPRRRGADIPSRRQSFLYRNEASEADKLANLVSEQLANVPGYCAGGQKMGFW